MVRSIYKNKKIWAAVFLGIITFLVLARDPLLARGINRYLTKFLLENKCLVDSITAEKNTTHIIGLQGENFQIKEAHIAWHLSLIPFRLEPQVVILQPVITCQKNEIAEGSPLQALAFLVTSPFFYPTLEIEGGEGVFIEEDFSFAFNVDPGAQEGEIGSLKLREKDLSADFLQMNIKKEKKGFAFRLELMQADLSLLSHYSQDWKSLSGSITSSASCFFSNKGRVKNLQAKWEMGDLTWGDGALDLSLVSKSLQGTLTYAPQKHLPLWKQIDLFLTFEDISVITLQNDSAFGFKNSLGEIRLHPEEDPYIKAFGCILSKGIEIPFEVEGKGEPLASGAYWIQASTRFFLEGKEPSIAFSLCQNEKGESILQAECFQVCKEIIDLTQVAAPFFNLPKYSMLAGEIQGKVLGHFEGKQIVSLEFTDCLAKELAFSLPAQNLVFRAEDLSFQGLLIKEDREPLSLVSSKMEMHKGDLTLERFQLSNIASCLTISSGEMESSYIEGTYSGIKASLQLLAPASENLFHLECGAYPKDVMRLFSFVGEEAEGGNEPILLALDIKEEKAEAAFAGTLRFCSSLDASEDLDFAGKIEKKISRKVKDLFSSWDSVFPSGVFHMDKISFMTVKPFLPLSLKAIEGEGKLEGSFDRRGVEILVKETEISFIEPSCKVSCVVGKQDPMRLYFSRASLKWEGVFPLESGFIEMATLPFPIELGESTFFLQGDRIWAERWTANVLSSAISGSLLVERDAIHVASEKITGKIASIVPVFLKDFPSIEGDFISAGDGLLLEGVKSKEGWDWTWEASFLLQGIHHDFTFAGSIENGSAFVRANSKGEFAVKDAKASYKLASLSCCLSLEDIFWQEGQSIDFTLSAKEASRELLLLTGKLEEEAKRKKISLSPMSHVLGLQFKASPFTIGSKGDVSSFDAEFLLKLRYLPSYLAIGEKIGMISSFAMPELDGDLQVKVLYNPATAFFGAQLHMEELRYKGELLGDVDAKIQRQSDIWKIYPSRIGRYRVESEIKIDADVWKINSFSIDSMGESLAFQGSYFPLGDKLEVPNFSAIIRQEQVEIRSKGSFEGKFTRLGDLQGRGKCSFFASSNSSLPCKAETVGESIFLLETSKGIEIGKSAWEIWDSKKEALLAKVAFSKMRQLKEKRLFLEEGVMTITKAGLTVLPKEISSMVIGKEASLQLDVDISPKDTKVSGSIKNGMYQIGTAALDMQQIRFLFEEKVLYVSSQTMWEKEPLALSLRMPLKEGSFSTILLKESPEKDPLSLQIAKDAENRWYLESAKGEFKGLTVALTRKGALDKKGLFYEADIQGDFSKVASFFSKKTADLCLKWKTGGGYRYLGSVTLSPDSSQITECLGEVGGNNFHLLGRQIQSFKAKVSFANDRVSLQNFVVEDPIGFLTVKAAEVAFNVEKDSWAISIPLIHMKDFSPSLFSKGKKEGVLIKNLSIYNLKGILGETDSYLAGLQATGALNFVSLTKKEFSFWDVPLSLIKDLGLDPSILTPVTGEAEFSLSHGKVYLTSLQNTYSEGMRSQFELAAPGTDSYLSLDGTWHIDLQMKQSVVWKVGEKLILSIRGNLEKPKYSFKIKDSSL